MLIPTGMAGIVLTVPFEILLDAIKNFNEFMLETIFIGYWPETWDAKHGHLVLFCASWITFTYLSLLPLSIYTIFVLEEKHGFNKQTFRFFMKDFVKSLFVSLAICPALLLLSVQAAKSSMERTAAIAREGASDVSGDGDLSSIWWTLVLVLAMLFLTVIYPDFIAPLFDNYTPVPDGPLKNRIEALASSIGFPLKKLYIVEASKRSAHSNAYLYGFYRWKRIVLFDTLIKGYVQAAASEANKDEDEKGDADDKNGCTDEEIEAILGHEIGHWKLSHIAKTFGCVYISFLVIMLTFVISYVLAVVVLICLLVAVGCFQNALVRRFEYQADAFSVQLGYGQHLKQALVKLEKDNLGFPVSDSLYSAWYRTHPTLLQRLCAINDEMMKLKKTE